MLPTGRFIAKSSFTRVARLPGSYIDTIGEALQLISTLKTSWLLILDTADVLEFCHQQYFSSGDNRDCYQDLSCR